jgi:hypothetical protein
MPLILFTAGSEKYYGKPIFFMEAKEKVHESMIFGIHLVFIH